MTWHVLQPGESLTLHDSSTDVRMRGSLGSYEMSSSVLDLIHCPFCRGTLNASGRNRSSDELEYAVLSCHCGRYPVVAGIPILKKGVIGPARQTADQVISLIEAGRSREALISLLMPSPVSVAVAPAWMQAWPSLRGIGRLKNLCGKPALRAWRKRAVAFLTQLGEHVTACDLFDFYFCYSTGDGRESYSYYAFRFGEPRYLAALSLAILIQNPNKPVLDLACGCGHLTRHLLRWAGGQPVIGLDRMFFSLYVAKNWLAPMAEYVCADANLALPFSDGTFSAAICSDAFHNITNKGICIRELKRLTQHEGFIVLATLRNALAKREHRYTYPCLPPEGYETLVADMPHRLMANRDILTRYLRKEGPSLADSTDMGRLVSEPWLSVVASHCQDVLRDYGCFGDWPHAEGHLALNPLYREEERDAFGNVRLRHVFPSPWYEEENGECRQYEPETVSLDAQVLIDVAQGQRTAEVERLLAQCVVVGLPERFLCRRHDASRR
jgi:ubiquinone/menaquinone biosynthesis C-methylase UbiE/uncharacterized protein YbaR (Trm112 family)